MNRAKKTGCANPKKDACRANYIKWIIPVLCFVLLVSQTLVCGAESLLENEELDSSLPVYFEELYAERKDTYQKYLQPLVNSPAGTQTVSLSIDAFGTEAGDELLETVDGRNAITLDGNGATITAVFTVETAGLYELEFQWYATEGNNQAIQMAVLLDGDAPFREALNIKLPRMWKDAQEIMVDSLGNEYSPRQVECAGWQVERVKSRTGQYSGAYQFYLTAGEHQLSIVSLQNEFSFGGCAFRAPENVPVYEDYCEINGIPSGSSEAFCTIYEAEGAFRKSSQSLSPSEDRTSPLTSPIHLTRTRINVIGQNWGKSGDWIEWEIDVPEDGYYQLYFRYLQNGMKGMASHRIITIDGVVPFAEAKEVPFAYSENWSVSGLKAENGDDAYIWLTKGSHILRMEVTTAEITEVVLAVEQVLADLNDLYKEIVMVTSVNPDKYTDYNLHLVIDRLKERLVENAALLEQSYNAVKELSGGKGNQAEQLNRFANQLHSFEEKTGTISRRLSEFKDNISALSAWLMDVRQQPLVLDSFAVCAAGTTSPYQEESFWSKIWFDLRAFVLSFFTDYSEFSSENASESITLWLSTGRDQAKILKTMIDDMFTATTGIGVDIKLANAALTQAYLSGDVPDVSIMQGRAQPVNLAARNALVALDGFENFDEVSTRFHEGALAPYYLGDHCYGLPDSQSFFMMFYRRDILKELELSPPETWDDFLYVANILQKNNMTVGLPYTSIDANASVDVGMSARNIFPVLIMQQHGDIFADDLTETALMTSTAQDAFVQWTNFYKLYGLPLTFDFCNRFRTGEMPIGIADYTIYNNLTVSAPEIEGLWKMVPIPGTREADGTINRTQASSGSAAVILKGCQNEEAAWKFLCFWTSEDAQLRYMQDIESLIGLSARYPSSNVNAVKRIGWSASELEALTAQWSVVEDIPEVVGGYYVVRGLDNAFRETVYEGRNPREALSIWNRTINEEISRKRKEFQNAAAG